MPLNHDTVEEDWKWTDIEEAAKRAGDESIPAFKLKFSSFVGMPENPVELFPSARQALTALLKALPEKVPKKILIPRFNCPVVGAAALAAGWELDSFDFSPAVGRFDWSRIAQKVDGSTGALLVTHYFGVPVDFRPIMDHCRQYNVTVIEDCAHSLGGRIAGRTAGTLGDAAIFSFNYDKPISLGWGGLALLNNSGQFERPIERHARPTVNQELRLLHDFVAAMTNRRAHIRTRNSLMFRVMRRAGWLTEKQFEKDDSISIGAVQAELGLRCLTRYPATLSVRNKNAARFATRTNFPTWPIGKYIDPAWLKQKVRVADAASLAAISKKLQRLSYRAGNFNWPNAVPAETAPDAQWSCEAAGLWMDVPIHQNLSAGDIDKIAAYLNSVK